MGRFNWKGYGVRSAKILSSSGARALARQSEARYAAQSLNRARRIRPALAGELKSVDVNGNSALNTTGALTLLNGMARGDDIADRDGRQVVMKSILLRGALASTIGTGTRQICRILLVYDKQTNATAPTIAQILSAANATAPYNLENRMRFQVLADHYTTIERQENYGGLVPFKFYKKINLPVTFNAGNAGSVADMATGSLYLVTLGSNVAGDTAGAFFFYSRVRFEDS